MTATAAEIPSESAAVDALGSSLPEMLLARAARERGRVALRQKQEGIWQETSWAQYAARAARVGGGLAMLGVQAGERVAIQSDNRPEWVFADLGIQGIGAATVGIPPSSPEAELEHVLVDSGAVVLVAEDEEQLDKALAARSRLPALRRIVIVDTRGIRSLADELLMSLEELEALAGQEPDELWRSRVAALEHDTVATIVYTSGTTGQPKGVQLTHANLAAAARIAAAAWDVRARDDVFSLVPLSHVAERVASVAAAIGAGAVVSFPESLETYRLDLAELQPTFLLGVPWIWEQMHADVVARMGVSTRLKRRVYEHWVRRGADLAARRATGHGRGGTRLAGTLGTLALYRPLRRKLGLGRARSALCAAAPADPSVIEWLWAIGVPVREVYGQSEDTGIATAPRSAFGRAGVVGPAVPGVELRLADDGEVLVRGPVVFAGYHGEEGSGGVERTVDGWLHTGDLGRLDDAGALTLTGRKKDLIVTAGGLSVSPLYLERLLTASPYLREAIVVGEGRPHLGALVTIEPGPVGEWARSRDVPFTTVRDLVASPEVRELVAAVVAETNVKLAEAEQIRSFTVLHAELDTENGQLTATRRVRRRVVAAQYADVIEEMYAMDEHGVNVEPAGEEGGLP